MPPRSVRLGRGPSLRYLEDRTYHGSGLEPAADRQPGSQIERASGTPDDLGAHRFFRRQQRGAYGVRGLDPGELQAALEASVIWHLVQYPTEAVGVDNLVL